MTGDTGWCIPEPGPYFPFMKVAGYLRGQEGHLQLEECRTGTLGAQGGVPLVLV